MLDKDKIIKSVKNRPGMENADVEGLYQDAIEDIMHFTHRTEEEISKLAIGSIIKDLMAYRFNTLGVEGIKSESFSGVSTGYYDDMPERIKKKLRSFRRLP
ncbi:phage head-tail connector protein [Helcococcus kunzii]|uniref:phage head-tail connector protein n=1 Tax=Helcococcus kunzii TaxID=40091 RepID=UPI0038A6F1BD